VYPRESGETTEQAVEYRSTLRPNGQGGPSRARSDATKEPVLPDYYLIPILLVLMSLGLTALIYWGGFVEESRNRRA